MNHVYWITDDLAGRCGPIECQWDLNQLYRGGFRTIVSLDDKIDAQEITENGFEHFPLYLPDVALSTSQLKEKFLKAAHIFVDFVISAKKSVLVHCHAGNDRTGAMLACYLVSQGKTAEEAILKVRRLNKYAMTTPGYEDAVHLFAELKGTR